MMHCGLLGQKLSHSYSPAIHSMLGDYEYKLYETEPENVETFLRKGDFDALNVTIPYKKCAAAICDELSETARAIGSVNTIVRRADGTLYGDNTDVYGFEELLRRAVFSPRAKKVLVLGSGGASAAVVYALEKQQAREIVVVSRDGKDNYSNLSRHTDAELIVNTTPVGMYPHNGEAVIDLLRFPHCRAVVDLIYNPVRTELLLQAEKLGIPCANGMVMLAAQAIRASEIFTGKKAASGALEHAIDLVKSKTMNIVLIGMPGCGKSAVAEALGKALGREVLDTDAYIEEHTGYTPEQIITMQGESVFRTHESEAVRELGSAFGAIVATGGGAVLHEENYAPLHQNGVIFWLRRDLDKLEREGDPMKILVINGPNLNLLGVREPELYGRRDFAALEAYIRASCRELGAECELFQSNHEGAIVDAIQSALGRMDGIVINPAAYTHTSVAILDALKAVALPAVEVHLTDIQERESFRHVSYAGMACEKTFAGLGFEGYRRAVEYLVNRGKTT